ncbi:MAG: hypothetical protein LKF40_05635 [Megasphaera sp.]|nr:hypothetical protein [Megasphaera sp.]
MTGKLENEAKENQELTTTFGTTQASYTYRRPRPHKARRRGYKSEVFMTPQVTKSNTYTLGVSSYENNSAARPDSQDITKTARDNANAFLDPFSLDTTGATVTPQQWKQAADKLTSSLYQLHPETTAKYLIETDPAFTNKKEFLSSDYMYDQMKWDPDKVPKRLGDGFYEQGLIRDQILNKSGQRYLDGYSDDMDEYKALMDAGVVYARETGLVPGVTLSAEQAAALTSDMVWLETKTIMIDGKPQTVVYPRVYLRANSAMTLHADGSLISAKQLLVDTKDAVVNQGILQGKTVAIQAGSIENTGRMQGNTIALSSDSSIHQGGLMTATDGVQLQAKQDITMDNTVDHLKNQDVLNRTAGIAVTGKDGVLLVKAGRDVNLAGATLQALGDKGAVVLQAGHDVNLTTQSLSAKKDMTLNKENYLRTQRQTEVGTTINTDGGAAILANHDITAKAAYINSDNGTVAVQAGNDIAVTTGRQRAVDDYGLKHKESGMVSSTTTTVRTHDDHHDNHWYIHIDGEGDYQVQNIKDVGDYYADLGYKVVLGQDGLSHYAISSDGVPYYTTYPLTSRAERVSEQLNTAKQAISDFGAGVISSVDDSAGFGSGQAIYEEMTGRRIDNRDSNSYYNGRIVGDVGSAVYGVGNIIAGFGGTSAGIAAGPETLGLSLTVSGAGVAAMAYGAGVVGSSTSNFNKDLNSFQAKNKLEDGEGFENNIEKINAESLPPDVKEMYDKYSEHDWEGNIPGQTPKTRAGGTFRNRNGDLPTTDMEGNEIHYREFDVNDATEQGRDAERFVVGSDGSIYYTDSHYSNFKQIK